MTGSLVSGEIAPLLAALRVVAEVDSDMTIGRLMAFLGVANRNDRPGDDPVPISDLWRELGGEDYCVYQAFANQLKLLSDRKARDSTGRQLNTLGLVVAHRDPRDYRHYIYTLTTDGKRLKRNIVKALGRA